MNLASPRFLSWLAFFLWFVAINVASMLPGDSMPKEMIFPHVDKVIHLIAFFFGGAIFYAALRTSFRPLRFPRTVLAFLFVSGIGVADEMRQLLTPGRCGADWHDMLANTAGALLGVFAAYCLLLLVKRSSLQIKK